MITMGNLSYVQLVTVWFSLKRKELSQAWSRRACPGIHVQAYMSRHACPGVHVQECMSRCTCPGVHVQVYMSMWWMLGCACPCVHVSRVHVCIPSTQKAETGVLGSSTPHSHFPKERRDFKAGEIAQLVKYLLRVHEDLSLSLAFRIHENKSKAKQNNR